MMNLLSYMVIHVRPNSSRKFNMAAISTIFNNLIVPIMLTGKAVQRAFRGLLLVPCSFRTSHDRFGRVQREGTIAPAQDITEMKVESFTGLPDKIVHEAETTRSVDTGETTPTYLEAVRNLFDEVLTGKVMVDEACMSQELTRIIERLDVKKQSIQASRTAELWLQFMKMMDICSSKENGWASGHSTSKQCMR